jgi:hypothetical protein
VRIEVLDYAAKARQEYELPPVNIAWNSSWIVCYRLSSPKDCGAPGMGRHGGRMRGESPRSAGGAKMEGKTYG